MAPILGLNLNLGVLFLSILWSWIKVSPHPTISCHGATVDLVLAQIAWSQAATLVPPHTLSPAFNLAVAKNKSILSFCHFFQIWLCLISSKHRNEEKQLQSFDQLFSINTFDSVYCWHNPGDYLRRPSSSEKELSFVLPVTNSIPEGLTCFEIRQLEGMCT